MQQMMEPVSCHLWRIHIIYRFYILIFFVVVLRFYLFILEEGKGERERERNIDQIAGGHLTP